MIFTVRGFGAAAKLTAAHIFVLSFDVTTTEAHAEFLRMKRAIVLCSKFCRWRLSRKSVFPWVNIFLPLHNVALRWSNRANCRPWPWISNKHNYRLDKSIFKAKYDTVKSPSLESLHHNSDDFSCPLRESWAILTLYYSNSP